MTTNHILRLRARQGYQHLFSIAAFFLILCSVNLNASEDRLPDHVGEISPAKLLASYPEFAKEYANYHPNEEELSAIKVLEGKEVMALFGTWCHDSEREIPRLLKLLDQAQVQPSELILYGVSRQKDDPAGYAEKYGLRYTPTLIVQDQGQEIARIIERPEGKLAADFAAQVTAKQ